MSALGISHFNSGAGVPERDRGDLLRVFVDDVPGLARADPTHGVAVQFHVGDQVPHAGRAVGRALLEPENGPGVDVPRYSQMRAEPVERVLDRDPQPLIGFDVIEDSVGGPEHAESVVRVGIGLWHDEANRHTRLRAIVGAGAPPVPDRETAR